MSGPDDVVIGAHVSTRGGIAKAIANGVAIGADVIQTHPTSAQQWRAMNLSDADAESFCEAYSASGLRGHYLHAIYLINLATTRPEHIEQSVESLTHHMEIARRLNADGVVFHTGSHLGVGFEQALPYIHTALRRVLDATPSGARLLIENSAGSGGCVGCSFDEIGAIISGIDDERIGVCLDTQHLFASGYDVRDEVSCTATLNAFERHIGFERLVCVHANDSLRPLGSNVDRHGNIGEGEIGDAGFGVLLRDARMRRVPWILEVPGRERQGPDREQIARLRGLAAADGQVAAVSGGAAVLSEA